MRRLLLIILGVVVVLGGFAAFDSMFTLHQTKQALVLQFGRYVATIQEAGLHFKVPFLQGIEIFDKRILDLDPPAQEVILADQKRINVDAFVRYKIVDPLEFKKKAVTQTNFPIGIEHIIFFKLFPEAPSIIIFLFLPSRLFLF